MFEKADVAVVGGGIVGCAVAYYLAKANVRTVVIERAQPGQEASSAAAGFLAIASAREDDGPVLELRAAAAELYATLGRELAERTGIDIDYRTCGRLELARTREEEARIRGVCDARPGRSAAAQWLSAEEACALQPELNRDLRGAAYFPSEGQVDAGRLTQALAVGAQRLGVEFVVGRALTGVNRQDSRVVSLSAEGEEIRAERVVIATGCWSGRVGKLFGLNIPVEPARGQMMACRADFPRHVVSWDDHYLIPSANGEVLIGSTVEFVGFHKEVTLGALRGFLEKTAAMVGGLEERPLGRTWAGLRPHSATARPILGAVRGLEGVILATGHFRDGILLGPITGKLIAELITSGAPSISLDPFGLEPVGKHAAS